MPPACPSRPDIIVPVEDQAAEAGPPPKQAVLVLGGPAGAGREALIHQLTEGAPDKFSVPCKVTDRKPNKVRMWTGQGRVWGGWEVLELRHHCNLSSAPVAGLVKGSTIQLAQTTCACLVREQGHQYQLLVPCRVRLTVRHLSSCQPRTWPSCKLMGCWHTSVQQKIRVVEPQPSPRRQWTRCVQHCQQSTSDRQMCLGNCVPTALYLV